jgi:hypothetical protein
MVCLYINELRPKMVVISKQQTSEFGHLIKKEKYYFAKENKANTLGYT